MKWSRGCHGSVKWGEGTKSLLLPWKEEKRVEHMSQDSVFGGRLPKELVSISADSRQVSQHALDARGPQKIKECRVAAPKGVRDCGLLKKEIGQIFG